MAWNKRQIVQHKQAAKILDHTIEAAIKYLKTTSNPTELDLYEYLINQFKINNLKTDKDKLIVAFGTNTSFVHYFPEKKSKTLKPETLILLDIWGRLKEKGAPFADITWMVYYGNNIPAKYSQGFKIISEARNHAISFIKQSVRKNIFPQGKEIDRIIRQTLAKYNCEKNFLHGTGHSLGFSNPHGALVRLNRRGRKSIPANVGYTIEPGIYFKNQYGLRSEIDFIINGNRVEITTKVQKKIIQIN